MVEHFVRRIDALPNIAGVDVMNEPFPALDFFGVLHDKIVGNLRNGWGLGVQGLHRVGEVTDAHFARGHYRCSGAVL